MNLWVARTACACSACAQRCWTGTLPLACCLRGSALRRLCHRRRLFWLARRSVLDVDSAGKTMFIALLGTVSLEVALVTRFWTWLFVFFLALSYFLVYPFEARAPSSSLPAPASTLSERHA